MVGGPIIWRWLLILCILLISLIGAEACQPPATSLVRFEPTTNSSEGRTTGVLELRNATLSSTYTRVCSNTTAFNSTIGTTVCSNLGLGSFIKFSHQSRSSRNRTKQLVNCPITIISIINCTFLENPNDTCSPLAIECVDPCSTPKTTRAPTTPRPTPTPPSIIVTTAAPTGSPASALSEPLIIILASVGGIGFVCCLVGAIFAWWICYAPKIKEKRKREHMTYQYQMEYASGSNTSPQGEDSSENEIKLSPQISVEPILEAKVTVLEEEIEEVPDEDEIVDPEVDEPPVGNAESHISDDGSAVEPRRKTSEKDSKKVAPRPVTPLSPPPVRAHQRATSDDLYDQRFNDVDEETPTQDGDVTQEQPKAETKMS